MFDCIRMKLISGAVQCRACHYTTTLYCRRMARSRSSQWATRWHWRQCSVRWASWHPSRMLCASTVLYCTAVLYDSVECSGIDGYGLVHHDILQRVRFPQIEASRFKSKRNVRERREEKQTDWLYRFDRSFRNISNSVIHFPFQLYSASILSPQRPSNDLRDVFHHLLIDICRFLWYDILCHVMSCRVMPCNIMICDAMSCHV